MVLPHLAVTMATTTTPSMAPHGEDEDDNFEVERVVDSRVDTDNPNRVQYLLKWTGYPDSDNTWEPEHRVDCTELVEHFHLREPTKPTGQIHAEAQPPSTPPPGRQQRTRRRTPVITRMRRRANNTLQLTSPLRHNSQRRRPPLPAALANPPQPPAHGPTPQETLDNPILALGGPTPFFTPLSNDPGELPENIKTKLRPQLTAIHNHSRSLASLPPPKKWKRSWKRTLKTALSGFAPLLAHALDTWEDGNGPALPLINATLTLLALPAHVLCPITGRANNVQPYSIRAPDGEADISIDTASADHIIHNPPSRPLRAPTPNRPIANNAGPGGELTESPLVLGARAAYNQGKPKKAKLVLRSNGVAPRTTATARVLRNMHLDRPEDLIIKEPTSPQIHITAQQADTYTRKAAKSANDEPDVFGWSMGILHCVAGHKTKGPDDITHQVARLISLIANCKAPPALTHMLTTGYLTPTNKIPYKEQTERIEAGHDPLVRPVNSGSCILKAALRLAAASPSGTKAIRSLQPVQFGQGVRSGPELVTHLARALNKLGYIITTQDVVNAFNAMNRQALLDTVHTKWPEAVNIFNTYYGIDSDCLYASIADNAEFIYHIFLSKQGTRMGCVLGTIGFNLVADIVYRHMTTKFPHFELFSLTDDCISGIPPPPNGDNSTEAWTGRLAEYTDYLAEYDSIGNPLGLFRHGSKGWAQLPPNVPLDLDNYPLPGTQTTRDQIKLAGTYVGPDAGVKQGTANRLAVAHDRFKAITEVGKAEPQMGLRLATDCGACAFDYVPRTTPPSIIGEEMETVTKLQHKTATTILQDPRLGAPHCSVNRLDRFHRLASLPTSSGGMAQTKGTSKQHAAYLASVLTAMTHPRIKPFAHALLPFVQHSYNGLCAQLNLTNIPPDHPLAAVLPPHADIIVNTSFAERFSLQNSQRRPQQVMMSHVSLQERRELRILCTQPDHHFSQQDRTHLLSITSKSQATRIFAADLFYKHNRVGADNFRPWARYYFNLPPTHHIGNAIAHADYDYKVERCLNPSCDHAIMTATHDHAASCPAAYSARSSLHRGMHDTVKYYVHDLGGTAFDPPKTSKILNQEFTEIECALIFPKDPNSADAALARQLQSWIRASAANGLPPLTRAVASALQRGIRTLTGRTLTARRLDLTFTLPRSHYEFLLDASCLHGTCKTHLASTTDWTKKVLAQELQQTPTPAQLAGQLDTREPSPPVQARVQLKNRTYETLMRLVASQVQRHKRTRPALLVPLVLSHAGEMAPDTFRMVNHLAEEKFRQLRATPDTAIRDPRADRAIYRGRIKDHLMATNSDWLGAMFNAAGLLGPPPARRTQQRHTQSSHHTSMHAGALRLLNSIQVLATQRSREQGGGLVALGGASSEPDELS